MHERLSVPIGRVAEEWSTRPGCRRVLAVAHTVTAVTRLMDVLPLFESDFRVQVVFTRARTSNFREGVTEYLSDLGVAVAPWEQAVGEEYDLAVTASLGDDLHLIKAPVVTVSHGAGYNKLGKPETGNRKPETGNRKPETDPHSHSAPGVFGISRETLVRDGVLIPSALVLSHEEQRDRVGRSCPEALPAAVVAGDPTFDRILAGRRWRDDYRRALGAADGRRLVLLTSTWGPSSLLGRRPELIRRVLRELPRDEYRVVLVAHPNAWYGHGVWQMRTWLASCERAGLTVLPPRAGWQAALAAADHVIGDHGSVTFYGAALGTHTMLGTFPHDELDPGSPVGAFGRSARVLDDTAPIERQLLDDAAAHRPDRFAPETSRLTSLPGRSGAALRALFYGLMNLDEPEVPARVTPPDMPEPLALHWPRAARVGPLLVEAEGDTSEVRVRRFPAEMYRALGGGPGRSHLLVDASEPDEAWRDSADVLIRREPTPGARAWSEGTLATETGLRIAAALDSDGAVVASLIPGTPRTATQDRPLTVRVCLQEATAGTPVEAGLAALWRADADGCDLWRPLAVKLHLGERTATVRIEPVD